MNIVLVDFQQVMISNLAMQLGNHQNAQLDEDLLRHMILNSLRSYRVKYPGEMVICCDTRHCWRKDVFPYYKARRATDRAASEIDWGVVFATFDKIKEELREFFPYRVIEVDGAEADDVIGVLAKKFGSNDEFGGLIFGDIPQVKILSGDKDFKQLHLYSNVSQYDPVHKKEVRCNNPVLFLRDQIIRGDKGDGVPNILSADDSIVTGTRQKQLREKIFNELMSADLANHPTHARNWKRNEQLIDLRHTPNDISEKILVAYESQAGKNGSKLANYFIAKRLKHLHESINDFF
jgi:hypothetical protein